MPSKSRAWFRPFALTDKRSMPIALLLGGLAAVAIAALVSLEIERATRAAATPVPLLALMQAEGVTGPRPTATVISSEALDHLPGKRVTTVLVVFPPGGFSPRHHHGGSVSVYVLSGAIRSQLEGGAAGVFKEGEMFFEPLGAVHVFAQNLSASEPARILATFIHEEGAELTTYH